MKKPMTLKAALKAYIKADLACDAAEAAIEAGEYKSQRDVARKALARAEKKIEAINQILEDIEVSEEDFDEVVYAICPEDYPLEMLEYGNWNVRW